MIDLSNKVVLITGGSRGIGAACVELFTKANAHTAFTYRSAEEDAKKLIAGIEKPLKINSYKVDLKNEKEISDCVAKVKADYGKIDILVNNAGIWNFGDVDSMELAHWQELLKINLDGMFLFTKYVSQLMKEERFGRIINISSTASQRGEAHHSHYAASKGAMNAFTKSIAVELAPYNITCNAVAPGWVDTDMNNEVFSDIDFKERLKHTIPVGRIATAMDIAGPVVFLATEYARHINGEILNVNGGSVLCG